METLFWVLVFLCFYGYLGYPLLAWCVSRFVNRLPDIPDTITTPVNATILVAAHNEAGTINAKLDSLLGQTYPQAHFDVLVLSDGSTDGTVEAVKAYANPRLQVLDLPRGGKAAALNAGVMASTSDVIVFSDADNEWEPDTLAKLLAPFQSERVGAVSGRIVIRKKKDKLGMGDWLYRRYESLLRDAETRLGSAVSADGGIFAIRRALYDGLPNDVTDDFYISTAAIQAGKALYFQPEAIACDEGLEHAEGQYRRRVRVTVRGMQSLWRRRALMNPLRYGWYSFCLISHKLIRRFVPFFALLLLPVNVWLLGENGFYQACALLQVLFYLMAGIGLLDHERRLPKPFKLAGFVLLSSVGLGVGIIKFLGGERYAFWTPQQHRS